MVSLDQPDHEASPALQDLKGHKAHRASAASLAQLVVPGHLAHVVMWDRLVQLARTASLGRQDQRDHVVKQEHQAHLDHVVKPEHLDLQVNTTNKVL